MKFEDAAKLMREGKMCTYGGGYTKYRVNGRGSFEGICSDGAVGFSPSLTVSLALQIEWREVQETHDFAWAREQLKQGRDVKRLVSTATCSSFLYEHLRFSLEDIDATDWVLV
jgi:hypothetical protein